MSNEKVSLTPSKRGNTTVLRIDRVTQVDESAVYHQGQGANSGLIINEQRSNSDDLEPAQLQLEFKCWLLNSVTGDKVPESRQLKFWFKDEANYLDKVTLSYEFFRELVQPDNFPRDYLNFVKKCMKQLQSPMFSLLKRIDVELTPLDSTQEQIIPVSQVKESIAQESMVEGAQASMGINSYSGCSILIIPAVYISLCYRMRGNSVHTNFGTTFYRGICVSLE